MTGQNIQFSQLFKKYRLKSEISTLSKLGHALAEKGFNYEDSIFSHWQNGTRTPQYRAILLKLIEIFSERNAITSIIQANDFLSSANQGYLTEQELLKFKFTGPNLTPFQVPNQIANFTGRRQLLTKIKNQFKQSNTFLFYGPPGVGKTALAIQVAHLLKTEFPDGVLWFRLDTSDVMDILLGIAYALGADVSNIQDQEIRGAAVRSLLNNKRILLIFDNTEPSVDINLLLPNAKNCLVIITSRNSILNIPHEYKSIAVPEFSQEEILSLFKEILGNNYSAKHQLEIFKLASIVGNLPLALQILAQEIKRGSIQITELISSINKDPAYLEGLSYENKNLQLALEVSLNLLDIGTKKAFISLAVFSGKDFSLDAVASVNTITRAETLKLLKSLQNTSLIEYSTNNRYRIHPMIKKFIQRKLDNPELFRKAASYYLGLMANYDKKLFKSQPYMKQEGDNVLYIFKKCYEYQYWNEVIALWSPLENLLFATKQLSKMKSVYQIAKNQFTGINIFQKIVLLYFFTAIIYWVILQTTGYKISSWNYFFSFSFTPLMLMGGTVGFYVSKSWGLFESSIGKAVFFISAGQISWGLGNLLWSYYNFFLNESVPYPSLADVGYLPSYLFWTLGIIHLPHAVGGESHFKKRYGKLIFIIPIIIVAISYYLVTNITQKSLLFSPPTTFTKLVFDIAYPISDAIILTAAFLVGISYKFFGGKYKYSIYTLMIGFCVLYIADYIFSYTTTLEIYYNGNFGDLVFAMALSFLTFGVLGFYLQNE